MSVEKLMGAHSTYLGNPMDRGAWWATVHEVTESDRSEVTKHACNGNNDGPRSVYEQSREGGWKER